MYSRTVMDHFLRPRNVGTLEGDLKGSGRNADCGDTVVISLAVSEGVIKEALFASKGCAGAIACCSATTELLTGSDLESMRDLSADQVSEHLGGLPEAKFGCAHMASEAARAAVRVALDV